MNNPRHSFTVNHNTHNIDGTHLQGYIRTTLDNLIETLGVPKSRRDYENKVTVEWSLELSDGTIIIIYDWKQVSTPRGLYNWNVGGHSPQALTLLGEILNLPIETF